MSQGGPNSSNGSGANAIETLTGNSGGAVGPDGAFNIDFVGNNTTGIDIVGTPASNLLTVIGLQSSETQRGTIEIATDAEAIAGIATDLAIVPSNLPFVFASPFPIGSTTPNTSVFTTCEADSFNTSNATTGLTITDSSIASDGTDANILLSMLGKGIAGTFTQLLKVNHSAANNQVVIEGATFTCDIIAGEVPSATTIEYRAHSITNTAALGPIIIGTRSRDAGGGTPAVVQNNDLLLNISAAGYDGADFATAGRIQCFVDNTPGGDDMPGRWIFSTSPDGTQTPSTVLTLNSSQNAIFTGDISTTGGSVTVDPGAATDSFIQFDESTTGKWRIGNDATDDSYRLSQGSALGTNDTFIMTSAGERTMPLQPAWLGRLPSNETNETGDGTTYILGDTDVGVAVTEIYDQSGDFTPGSSNGATFTSPVSGIYYLNCLWRIGSIGTTTDILMNLITSNRTYETIQCTGAGVVSGGGIWEFTSSVTGELDAGDVARTSFVANGAGGLTVGIRGSSHFGGFLAC